jgi:hypothetical protein
MSDITIQDNIPIPRQGQSTPNPAVETARKLNVGQSFVWPNPDKVDPKIMLNRARGVLMRVDGMKFTTRVVVEQVQGEHTIDMAYVVRVWRIA